MRAALFLTLLVACSDSKPATAPSAGQPATPPAAAPAEATKPAEAAPAEAAPAEAAPAEAAPAPAQAIDHEKLGTDLMSKETIGGIAIGAEQGKVTDVAGKPKKKPRAEMSEGLGVYMMAMNYPDAGLEVMLASDSKKGPFRVNSLKIAAPSTLKTSKGIGVGSSVDELAVAYPRNPEDSNEGQFVTGTLYGGLVFQIAAGKVESIFLGASAE